MRKLVDNFNHEADTSSLAEKKNEQKGWFYNKHVVSKHFYNDAFLAGIICEIVAVE